jgi:hypothetical protein
VVPGTRSMRRPAPAPPPRRSAHSGSLQETLAGQTPRDRLFEHRLDWGDGRLERLQSRESIARRQSLFAEHLVGLLAQLPAGPLGERQARAASGGLKMGALLLADRDLNALTHTHVYNYSFPSCSCHVVHQPSARSPRCVRRRSHRLSCLYLHWRSGTPPCSAGRRWQRPSCSCSRLASSGLLLRARAGTTLAGRRER